MTTDTIADIDAQLAALPERMARVIAGERDDMVDGALDEIAADLLDDDDEPWEVCYDRLQVLIDDAARLVASAMQLRADQRPEDEKAAQRELANAAGAKLNGEPQSQQRYDAARRRYQDIRARNAAQEQRHERRVSRVALIAA